MHRTRVNLINIFRCNLSHDTTDSSEICILKYYNGNQNYLIYNSKVHILCLLILMIPFQELQF